jgi:hypothetical protein
MTPYYITASLVGQACRSLPRIQGTSEGATKRIVY